VTAIVDRPLRFAIVLIVAIGFVVRWSRAPACPWPILLPAPPRAFRHSLTERALSSTSCPRGNHLWRQAVSGTGKFRGAECGDFETVDLAHARARFGHSTAGGRPKQVLAANLAALAVLKTLTTLSVSSLLPCSARPLVLHQHLSTIDHFGDCETYCSLSVCCVDGAGWLWLHLDTSAYGLVVGETSTVMPLEIRLRGRGDPASAGPNCSSAHLTVV
jgi:hypothetical protein